MKAHRRPINIWDLSAGGVFRISFIVFSENNDPYLVSGDRSGNMVVNIGVANLGAFKF